MSNKHRYRVWPIRSNMSYPDADTAVWKRLEYMARYGVEAFVCLHEEEVDVSDGVVLWVVVKHRGGSSPSNVQLTVKTWAEGVRLVQSLRARLRREPIFEAKCYEEKRAVMYRCDEIMAEFGTKRGFKKDHHFLWHRSPEWLGRLPRHSLLWDNGATWREKIVKCGGDLSCWDGAE